MSFSEDPSSPAAPFSGDGSGQIFDMGDLVAGSATTSERIVDTQSGFLVVVKRLNDRLALSIKRHIGTPPGSSVPLTPDETLKLSRILAGSLCAGDDWNSISSGSKERRSGRDRRRPTALTSGLGGETAVADLEAAARPPDKVPVRLVLASVLRTFIIPVLLIAVAIFALGIGAGITGSKLTLKEAPAVPARTLEAGAALDPGRVDVFVRAFVAKMLDFSSKTYRVSQVQAMASMSPELLERYWQETRFPLSRRQLSALPRAADITVVELKQTPLDAATVSVDVHAQISGAAGSANATPVKLRLKLALDPDNKLIVVDQQDLSSAAAR